MKSDKQAHTYGSNFSDFEDPSESNSTECFTLSGEVPLEEAIEDFKLWWIVKFGSKGKRALQVPGIKPHNVDIKARLVR